MPLPPRSRRGGGISANSNQEGIAYDWFLKQALLSQVYDLVKETPIQYLPVMSNELNNQIFAKREEMQTGFSFCTRGAHHLLLNLTLKTRPTGIVVASAGNYGNGVGLSAKYLGIDCVNVVPENSNAVKIRNLKRNSDVIAFGSNVDDSINFAKQLAKMNGYTFVSLDDPLMIAGHATIAVEILRQSKQNFDYIFVPIGTGNLARAIGTYLKRLKPMTKIIGVAMQNSDLQSVFACDHTSLLNMLDDVVYVDSTEVKNSILDYYEDTRTVLEPYGALSIAAARKWLWREQVVNSRVLLLTTGSNVDLQDASTSQLDNPGRWDEEKVDEVASGAISHGIMPSSFVRFVPKQSKSCKYGLRIVQPQIIHSTPSKFTVGLGVSQISRWDAADHFANLVYEGRS